MLPAAFLAIQQPLLTPLTYDEIRAQIVPPALTDTAEKVPWMADLWTAVVYANQMDMPVLLWVMNGHPLGCT